MVLKFKDVPAGLVAPKIEVMVWVLENEEDSIPRPRDLTNSRNITISRNRSKNVIDAFEKSKSVTGLFCIEIVPLVGGPEVGEWVCEEQIFVCDKRDRDVDFVLKVEPL